MLSLQMFYKDENSVNARGFSTTSDIYKEGLGMSWAEPCERVNPQHISSFLPSTIPSDICDVCAINGDQIGMVMCECCNERGKEVQACYTCLPQIQRQWLLKDREKKSHHWRCSSCR